MRLAWGCATVLSRSTAGLHVPPLPGLFSHVVILPAVGTAGYKPVAASAAAMPCSVAVRSGVMPCSVAAWCGSSAPEGTEGLLHAS